MLHIPTLWYFDISVIFLQGFHRIKFVITPPCFTQQQYLRNIAIQLAAGWSNLWANRELFRLLTAGGKIIVKQDYSAQITTSAPYVKYMFIVIQTVHIHYYCTYNKITNIRDIKGKIKCHQYFFKHRKAHIKNSAWVTVNMVFGSRVRRFAKDFHEWRSHEWKSLVNLITSDPKIVIHFNECTILFLTCYFMSWTHNSAKNNHRSLIFPLSPRMVVSCLALWRHHSGSVTSCEREILALWRHIRQLFSHAQIGANAIFTSE